MFIRVKTKPGNPRKAVQLVESVREGRKVSQRIVRHIGVAETEAELDKLKELGETIKVGIRCERQPSLVPQEKLVGLAVKARRETAKKGPPVAVEEIREERRIVTGFHEAYGAVHRELGFDGLLPAGRNRFGARGAGAHGGGAHRQSRQQARRRPAAGERSGGFDPGSEDLPDDGPAGQRNHRKHEGPGGRRDAEAASGAGERGFLRLHDAALRIGRGGRAARVRLLQERPARPGPGAAGADGRTRRAAVRVRGVPGIGI